MRRKLAFVVVAGVTAMSLLAAAQQPRRPARPPAVVQKKPPTKPAPSEADASGPLATREDTRPVTAQKDAGLGGGVVEQKTLDGGAKVFRFGEVEVEGRLKSPQIVYFLRRVRAEFAAGDLGHRSFVRELDETKNEPGF
ncbi:MAG TPA: hypothetical protein VIF62_19335 [Labilithrix sp.]